MGERVRGWLLAMPRRRKAALVRLRKENARLRRTVEALRRRVGTQEAELVKLRATRAVLSKALRGRKSEKRQRPGTGRPRGQRCGAPGHGRTPRCGLEERIEERSLPAATRRCSGLREPPESHKVFILKDVHTVPWPQFPHRFLLSEPESTGPFETFSARSRRKGSDRVRRERRHSSAGANPARQLSLQPVAVGADDGGNDIG